MSLFGPARIFSLVLALLITACLCGTQTSCNQTPAPKSTVWTHPEPFASYLQRRCAPVEGPEAPVVLWQKDFAAPETLQDLHLRPDGGVLLHVQTDDYDIFGTKEGDAKPRRIQNRLLVLDKAGNSDWEAKLETGGEGIQSDELSLSELTQDGLTFYLGIRRYKPGALGAGSKRSTDAPKGALPDIHFAAGNSDLTRYTIGSPDKLSIELNGEWISAAPFVAADSTLFIHSSRQPAIDWDFTVPAAPENDPALKQALPESGDVVRRLSPALAEKYVIERKIGLDDPLITKQGPLFLDPLACDEDGNLYLIRDENWLWKLDPDGKVLWRRELENRIYATPILRRDGSVLVASDIYSPPDYSLGPESPEYKKQYADHTFGPQLLTCFGPNGDTLWTRREVGACANFPAIDSDGSLVCVEERVSSPDPRSDSKKNVRFSTAILKLDPAGKEQFRYDLADAEGKYAIGCLCLDAAGNAYWSNGKRLLSLEPGGKLRFSIELPDVSFSLTRPFVQLSPTGELYVWGSKGILCLGDS